MADQEQTGRRIQVANARPEDAGRGLARLPLAVMAQLQLSEGDVIEIVGKRNTPARVVRPYKEDEGLDVLRLDGLQRANAGVGSGDFVQISKAEPRAAQRVVFAPAQNNLRLQGNPEALKRVFYQRPLASGDVVATAGQQQVPPGDGVTWKINPGTAGMLTSPSIKRLPRRSISCGRMPP